MSVLGQKLLSLPSTLSLPAIEREIARLEELIDEEQNQTQRDYLCAAYQALCWARDPGGYAAPSTYNTRILQLVKRK